MEKKVQLLQIIIAPGQLGLDRDPSKISHVLKQPSGSLYVNNDMKETEVGQKFIIRH